MKKFASKVVAVCGISLCAVALLAGNGMPVYASEGAETKVENSRATNLEWVYKYFDGVLYMRLWNHSTGEWVTDWILAD